MARKQNKKTENNPETFCLTAGEASSVALVGDFTHWQEKPISMAKAEGGVWTVTVKLPPGVYHYRFLVDGQWHDDPECRLRVANPYGGENSVRKV